MMIKNIKNYKYFISYLAHTLQKDKKNYGFHTLKKETLILKD